jgi:glutathione S-transferase
MMRLRPSHAEEPLMLTLFHSPRSRSSAFLWMLEELGAPYDIEYVSIRRGDGSGALDPKNPHPHGKVPVLKDGSQLVFEQTAIALYLADRFPDADLGPRPEDAGRGEFLTMLAYYSGVIEPAFMSKFLKVTVPRGTAGWVDSDESMDFVNARLAAHAYILGDAFTVADILYAGAFALFMNSPLLAAKKTPRLEQYVARCTSRPARARALAKDEDPQGVSAQ